MNRVLNNKWIVFTVLLVAFVLFALRLIYVNKPYFNKTQIKVYDMNQSVNLKDLQVKIKDVSVTGTIDGYEGKKTDDDVFLIIDVNFKNNSIEDASLYKDEFMLQYKNLVFPVDIIAFKIINKDSSFLTQKILNSKQEIQGKLVYLVPKKYLDELVLHLPNKLYDLDNIHVKKKIKLELNKNNN
ncbi:DUF4352 domain-containing protein [Bacillus cereus]|uniref:DUF4352 domain-containing protein n=1 Tax=Bacillus thuringiensis TaxID=1428 RepID=A0A9X6ZSP4_BACTU|nr:MULTISPECIES: DUF4352 domain-containing protein [Bacillus cereus group]ANV74366.1 hypothetical protein BCM43_28355 [Bacillus thuringiensis]MCU7756932.1 DUF4352 domain-containing protein [Bacillus cereus]MDA2627530.1 DUF4352 domain-containing protein [Bacillus cereus]MDC7752572.1 DUF4352 domain-containing protein [Bacillus cereus]PFD02744.1 DUF4352 domain-containing protein [Bacillus cereus]